MLLLGEGALHLLRGEILLRLREFAPQGKVRIIWRLVLSDRVLHRLVLVALRCAVQRRVVDVLHFAEVLHRVMDVLNLAEVLHRVVDVLHLAEVLYLAVDMVV